MIKTNKKVIKLELIQRLAELFPDLTIKELLQYIDYCRIIKQKMNLDIVGVTEGDEVK